MSFSGRGKTYLTELQVSIICDAWYNADKVREIKKIFTALYLTSI